MNHMRNLGKEQKYPSFKKWAMLSIRHFACCFPVCPGLSVLPPDGGNRGIWYQEGVYFLFILFEEGESL